MTLLSSAIDRSAGGKVEMELAASPEEALIVVRATGQAIPPGPLSHVVDIVLDAEGERRAARGGMGIGLAIACDLVDLHGGSLAASSLEEGWGAVFTVTLPLKDARTESEASAEHPRRLEG